MSKLFHVSGWSKLQSVSAGDTFKLIPGPQGAEGSGVYFSEGVPRISAAEGAGNGVMGIICINRPTSPKGWYRTKNSVCRKFGRPRTWHSAGKDVELIVNSFSGKIIKIINCSILI